MQWKPRQLWNWSKQLKIVFHCIEMWEWEKVWGFRWVGWPVARRWSFRSAVGKWQQQHILFSHTALLHNYSQVTQWFGWWRLFIHFSPSSPYSMHVVHTFLQMLFALVSLTDNSLYRSTVYMLAQNVLLASLGRAQKSKQNHNKLLQCSLHDFPISSPFLLASSQSHTHSRYPLSCMANQIPWSIHKANHKGPNRIEV